MKLEKAITKRICDLCNERDITPNKLASMAGMPSATIRCIFYGRSKSWDKNNFRYMSSFKYFNF